MQRRQERCDSRYPAPAEALRPATGGIERCDRDGMLSRLSGRPGRTAGTGLSKGESEIEAGHAVGFLLTLVSLGYRNLNEIQAEAALDSLHSRGDFKCLMMGVAFRLEPFAWAE